MSDGTAVLVGFGVAAVLLVAVVAAFPVLRPWHCAVIGAVLGGTLPTLARVVLS